MIPTSMDCIRGALAYAMDEGLTEEQVWQAAEACQTPQDFYAAIDAVVDARDTMALAMEAYQLP